MEVNDSIIKRYKSDVNGYTTSRYKRLNRVIDNEGDEYIESYEDLVFPKRNDDKFYEVESKYENRLDLISYKFYGTPLLYWVIAEASELVDPQIVPVGTLLRIPNRQSLYGVGGKLL